ncbi:MAG: GNAT family N-acetyltransferase [Corynebacteriales bacterium]|uniref:GNAT family N-acetyltransferase n=1 Tax=Williamsia herbipolensis TaxID=1603258 RepID=A0AAU4K737_9NOCA|nr:GNAT family N-acetyltransferase [Williamsia herbipolensis]MCX6469752.1 GNAT family N-acetyltransferase [Mycobacteriales bacterium]
MTDHDRAATRREITTALSSAFERRHEVLDAIVDAPDRAASVTAIAALLSVSPLGAEAVMGMSFEQLTVEARRANQAELEDLDSQLTFTLAERPAATGDSVTLRQFDTSADADLFSARTAEIGAAGDGSGKPAAGLDDEIASASDRMFAEEAAWFVAHEGSEKIGLVFGELVDGEVNVRIWIRPEHRKKGYGTAALRASRSEMASQFPGVPMVVRAPGAQA